MEQNFIQQEMELWRESENVAYLQQLESALSENFSPTIYRQREGGDQGYIYYYYHHSLLLSFFFFFFDLVYIIIILSFSSSLFNLAVIEVMVCSSHPTCMES